MLKIPYYDSDKRLIDHLSLAKAERYVAEGIARAIRSGKDERIRRLYRKSGLRIERTYGSSRDAISQMSGAASGTTRRIQNEWGVIVSGPMAREHKRGRF